MKEISKGKQASIFRFVVRYHPKRASPCRAFPSTLHSTLIFDPAIEIHVSPKPSPLSRDLKLDHRHRTASPGLLGLRSACFARAMPAHLSGLWRVQ